MIYGCYYCKFRKGFKCRKFNLDLQDQYNLKNTKEIKEI